MLKALVDARFETLLARRFLGIAYTVLAIATLLAGLAVLLICTAAGDGASGFIIGLLIAVPATFLQLLILRLLIEGFAVFFRMADDVRALTGRSDQPAT